MSRRLLPLPPLLEEIRRCAPGTTGRRELARWYAARFGEKPASVERQLMRMLHTWRWIGEEKADRWCTLLGLHLDMLWPPEVEA